MRKIDQRNDVHLAALRRTREHRARKASTTPPRQIAHTISLHEMWPHLSRQQKIAANLMAMGPVFTPVGIQRAMVEARAATFGQV